MCRKHRPHEQDFNTTPAVQCPGSSVVEQWIENPRVGGSTPPLGTTFHSNLISQIFPVLGLFSD